jgi:hypothetical protein
MITVIHGDDIAASRKYFFDLKKKYPDARLMSSDSLTITDLTQELSGGLFDENKQLFIEELLSKKAKSKEADAILSYLSEQSENHDIYLWESKLLTKSSLGKFKRVTDRAFKIPQTLFAMLDAVKPGNSQEAVALFHKALDGNDTEMIFYMLVRHLRILLAIKEPSNDQIDEVTRLAPWQRGKLSQQAALFTKDDLKKLYSDCYEIDRSMKTGTLPPSMTHTIDFLLASL